jgi:Spy/CpxP family protein refolding chaperone
MALVLAAAFVAAQDQPAPRARRGFAGGMGRGGLLSLLAMEQVQKELKLSEEQLGKVKKVTEDLTAEMRKQSAALRDIEDREKRQAEMTKLADQFDQKAREQLRDVLTTEQTTRLFQIRMQVRSVVDNLGSKDVADKLKLTEEQKKKVAQMAKDLQTKQSELLRDMRDATAEQRTEAFEKLRKLRSDTDKAALEVLTEEQSKTFKEMQGKKIELKMERRPRPPA